MKIRVGFDLTFDCPQPTPMIVMLNIHYSRVSDIVVPGSSDRRSFGSRSRAYRDMLRQLVQPARRAGRAGSALTADARD